MKVKYLFIALLIALTISLVACDGDATPAATTADEATVATTTDGASVTTKASTTAATTKSGVIELPPVDVR